MTVIKICDSFLKTNLNSYDAGELLESAITDHVVENGEDFPFNLDDFIEEFVEQNNKFETMEDSHDWDIEYSPEEIDEIVEQAILDGNDEGGSDEDDSDDLHDDDADVETGSEED